MQHPTNDSHLVNNNDLLSPEEPGYLEASTNDAANMYLEASTNNAANTQQNSVSPVQKLIQTMMAELSQVTAENIEGEIYCLEAISPNYAGQPELDPLQIYKATSDPDTMYMHEAMKEPDAGEFKKAMQKE